MEEWKDIVDYEYRYQISNYGKVRRLFGGYRHGKKIKPPFSKILKGALTNSGYIIVRLFKNHKYKNISMHRLVAIHFIPNPENKPCVCHKNDIKTDNVWFNLFWGTHKENSRDSINKNRGAHGSKQGLSKLSDELIPKIRELILLNIPQRKIAKTFNVSQRTIFDIKIKRTWNHVA